MLINNYERIRQNCSFMSTILCGHCRKELKESKDYIKGKYEQRISEPFLLLDLITVKMLVILIITITITEIKSLILILIFVNS